MEERGGPLLASGRWNIEAAAQRQCSKKASSAPCHQTTGVGVGGGQVVTYHQYHKRPTNKEEVGPFVFGVHGPSQFPLRSRFPSCSNNDYDDDNYDSAYEGDDRSVIDERSNFCSNDRRRKVYIKPTEKKDTNKKRFRLCRGRCKKSTTEEGNAKEDDAKNIKCVLVGDGAVGKTSLVTSYAQNLFQYDYRPTTFDKYDVKVQVDGKPICIQIFDTSGQDHLEGVRELCYPGSDVILLCFSVVKPESFRSIANRWVPGVSSTRAPYVLVGTQCDLRDDYGVVNDLRLQGEQPITEADARLLASKLNAPYIETSSKTRSRLKDAFDSAILAALPYKKQKRPLWRQIFCLS